MSINRVNISGNLTRDPELRTTQGGTAVLSFGVAVNDRVKDANGEWTDRPNFIDVTLFGKRAEALAQYLAKGSKVAIEGRLRWSQWQDKETGKNRSKIEVIADEVELMSRRQDGQQAAPQATSGPSQPAYAAPAPTYQAPQPSAPQPATVPLPGIQQPPAPVYDKDIPF